LPLLLAATLLTACSSFTAAPPPSGQDALIYVYRADQLVYTDTDRDTLFYVDAKHVFDLDKSGSSFAYVPGGRHELAERTPRTRDMPKEGITRTIVVKAGETRYFRCCRFAIFSDMDFTEYDGFVEVPAEQALWELWYTHLRQPVTATP
jgi:hypothetical protein